MGDSDHDNLAILTDVDMTLLPSMSTASDAGQRRFILDLHERLKGAFAMVTGRPGNSIDRSFPGDLPASVEHHAAWRPKQGENYIALAPALDSAHIAEFARRTINGSLTIFDSSHNVTGDRPGVFIEQKNHSLALVFAAAATPSEGRKLLEVVADRILDEFDLSRTHRKAVNSDSVEVVPLGLSKGNAVRQFMGTPAFQGRAPVFMGDSSSDDAAMKVCAEEFGGWGIAVGSSIPDAPYIRERVKDIAGAWDALRRLARMPS